MSNIPTHPLIDRFASLIRWLTLAVVAQGIVGRLASPGVGRLVDHFRTLKWRFARLVARVHAGTYRPRRAVPRREATAPTLRPPGASAEKFGWLAALLPDAAQHRSQLLALMHQPDMATLISAAPAATARALRPLCWALGLKPPALLPAAPRRPRPAAPPAPAPVQKNQAEAAAPPRSGPADTSPSSPTPDACAPPLLA